MPLENVPVGSVIIDAKFDDAELKRGLSAMEQTIKRAGVRAERSLTSNVDTMARATRRFSSSITAIFRMMATPAIAVGMKSIHALIKDTTWQTEEMRNKWTKSMSDLNAGFASFGVKILKSNIAGKSLTEWISKLGNILKNLSQKDAQRLVNAIKFLVIGMTSLKVISAGITFTQGLATWNRILSVAKEVAVLESGSAFTTTGIASAGSYTAMAAARIKKDFPGIDDSLVARAMRNLVPPKTLAGKVSDALSGRGVGTAVGTGVGTGAGNIAGSTLASSLTNIKSSFANFIKNIGTYFISETKNLQRYGGVIKQAFSSAISVAGGTAIGTLLAGFGKMLLAGLVSLFSAAFVGALIVALTAVLSLKKIAEQIGNLVASGGTSTETIPIEAISEGTLSAKRYRKAADERMYQNISDDLMAKYQYDKGNISTTGISANKMTWDKEKAEYTDTSWLMNKLFGGIRTKNRAGETYDLFNLSKKLDPRKEYDERTERFNYNLRGNTTLDEMMKEAVRFAEKQSEYIEEMTDKQKKITDLEDKKVEASKAYVLDMADIHDREKDLQDKIKRGLGYTGDNFQSGFQLQQFRTKIPGQYEDMKSDVAKQQREITKSETKAKVDFTKTLTEFNAKRDEITIELQKLQALLKT